MYITRFQPVAVVVLASALFLGSTQGLTYQTLAEDQPRKSEFQTLTRQNSLRTLQDLGD
jgi:hypothetical protein